MIRRQAVFWANLGMMLKIDGQFDAALDAYDEALARAPGDRQIRVNRAVTRLHAGRFAEAWQDEDWVLAEPGRSVLPADRLLPPLSRLPDLTGRTVLVLQEEGLGDTLQFLRYLPLLARRGARVVAVVPPALTRLMRTVPGVAEVPDGDAPVPRFDFHCSFNGLPRAFETTLETIPCEVPYLAADPALVRQWRERLPAGDALRVGLCWAGQARPWLAGFVGLDRRRSTDLATLAPLAAVPGVRFISLQKGPAASDSGRVRSARRHGRGARLRRHRRDRRQSGPGDQRRYLGRASRGCDGQAGVPARSLRQLLALAQRTRGQPVVSVAAHLPPAAQRRLGAGDRARRYGACCSGRPSIPGAGMPRCRMMLGARSVT